MVEIGPRLKLRYAINNAGKFTEAILCLFSTCFLAFILAWAYLPHDCEIYNSFVGMKIGNSSSTAYDCCDTRWKVYKRVPVNCKICFHQSTIYKSSDNNTVCTFSDDYYWPPIYYPNNIYSTIYYNKKNKCFSQQNNNLNSCKIKNIMLICLLISVILGVLTPLWSEIYFRYINDECCASLPSKQVPNNECDNASESSNSDIEIECDDNNKNKTKFIIEFPNFY
jgi:hypothetical protein